MISKILKHFESRVVKCRRGGGGDTIVQSSAPPPQSTQSSIEDYVASLPALYQAQLTYDPQLVAQQVALAQQYAAPYGQAMKAAQEALYPETAALQEQMAGQAATGIESGLSDQEREMYRDVYASNIGTNIGSGIGADYMSTGMLQAQQARQDYYRNLGLSLAGRQPLATPQVVGQTGYMQGYQPSQALNYQAGTYGSYAGSFDTMYRPDPWMQLAGQTIGAAGNVVGGMATGGTGFFSSRVLKENIKAWE